MKSFLGIICYYIEQFKQNCVHQCDWSHLKAHATDCSTSKMLCFILGMFLSMIVSWHYEALLLITVTVEAIQLSCLSWTGWYRTCTQLSGVVSAGLTGMLTHHPIYHRLYLAHVSLFCFWTLRILLFFNLPSGRGSQNPFINTFLLLMQALWNWIHCILRS